VAASSGPTDVVFLLDKKFATDETLLREALDRTVGKLGSRYYFAVGALDADGADVLGGNNRLA
jgi:hypothetical protein